MMDRLMIGEFIEIVFGADRHACWSCSELRFATPWRSLRSPISNPLTAPKARYGHRKFPSARCAPLRRCIEGTGGPVM